MLLTASNISTPLIFINKPQKRCTLTAHKKGLSHKMDLAFDDMFGKF